ncbi:hypothetical protein L5515_013343 [Caenorhabditis briggsae]|uniref:GH18 domain-containing protein n=1 Tax=Caenorhabditis briggsae TaxID=6238 RepID=A0AAE9E8V3_CAEBR|nr:hypothetical protein L5515_013343 [Caenorhabditis briggsae]
MSPTVILDKKPLKVAFCILAILIICAIISFALSTSFWYIYDYNNNELPCRFRLVGYYSYWTTSEVTLRQLRKLTHISFVFLAIDENGSLSFAGDSGEERFLQMKKIAFSIRPDIKVMFSVGSDKTAFHFSKIVAEREKKRFLINSIISFLDENDLDGVDVFWSFPSKQDRRSYIRFLRELKKSLVELKIEKGRTEDYVISIIAPQNPSEFEGFNLVEIMESVDFVNVLTYEYYFTSHKVGPLSPLYGGSEGNVDETMKYLSCKTKNPRKLNMGVSFYGNRFLNTELPFGNNSIWIPMNSETKGPFRLQWNEITPNEKAITKWDNVSRTTYVYDDRKFLTFENEKSMREKMKYAEDHNIGGISIWVIDEDDDENTLLNVVSSVDLCTGSSLQTYTCALDKCYKMILFGKLLLIYKQDSKTTTTTAFQSTTSTSTTTTPLPTTTTTDFQSTTTSRQLSSSTTSSKKDSKLPPAASCGKRVVGYFTEWENADLREEQLGKLTHVIYLFATVQDDGSIKLDNKRTEKRFLDLKDKAHSVRSDLKMMIGVGGHATSYRFSSIVSDDGKRKILIDSIVSFIDEQDLDGVDIFWIWSYEDDKLHYSKFLRELRKALNILKSFEKKKRAEDYLISLIIPPKIATLAEGYDINEILKSVDFLNVLTYDYYFNGDRVGPHSPIYGGTRGNIDETMKYLTCKTRQPSKINMAVPFYGTFWRNASLPLLDDSDEIWKDKGNAAGPFAVRWRELVTNGWDKSTTRFHEKSKTSYIWISETKHFLTFENERSLAEKAKYVKEHQLGGILIWAIDQDDDQNTLLNAVSSADICSQKEKEYINYICDK